MTLLHEPAPTALETRDAVAQGRSSALQVTDAALARVDRCEPALHAWKALDPELARQHARAIDAQRARGEALGPLAGVPVGIKDIFDTADLPTGYGSAVYEGFRPAADADAVAALRRLGAVPLGKTVSTEFAYFTPGPTANPWNPAHTPGGSSSGSAAAVASGMVPLALGTQTAGSIIRPASFCGIFGLKPTHGRFSLRGAKAFAPSLDTLGALARSASDLELLRCALADEPFRGLDRLEPAQVRLLSARTHEWPSIDGEGAAAWDRAHAQTGKHGLSLRDVAVPQALAGLAAAQKTVMAWEAARCLADEMARWPDRLSAPLREIIEAGRQVADADVAAARALAGRGRDWLDALLADADALMVPAAPGQAPAGLAATGDPVFSRVWTLLGVPCVNVPGLRGRQGLPIGIQLVGRAGSERLLLALAAMLQPMLDEGGAA